MAVNKTLLSRLVQKKDTIQKWENSTLPIKYGELTLAYEDGILTEIRAGEPDSDSQTGLDKAWSKLGSSIPVFIKSQTTLLKGLVKELDDNTKTYTDGQRFAISFESTGGLPTLVAISSGGELAIDETLQYNDSNELGVSDKIIWQCNPISNE